MNDRLTGYPILSRAMVDFRKVMNCCIHNLIQYSTVPNWLDDLQPRSGTLHSQLLGNTLRAKHKLAVEADSTDALNTFWSNIGKLTMLQSQFVRESISLHKGMYYMYITY